MMFAPFWYSWGRRAVSSAGVYKHPKAKSRGQTLGLTKFVAARMLDLGLRRWLSRSGGGAQRALTMLSISLVMLAITPATTANSRPAWRRATTTRC